MSAGGRCGCGARRSGEVVPFEPGPVVTMYTCGITPYDATHLGHAAVYVTYDVLQRRLRDLGHETRCVRNITDVDDSILGKARELGVHYLDLAAAETARFDDDIRASACCRRSASRGPPRPSPTSGASSGWSSTAATPTRPAAACTSTCRRSPSSARCPGYDEAQMLAYAKERGGNVEDPHKRNPLDFVLWQPSLDDEPSWDSLWGPGRPGWHIECSALAMRELGTTIDLHGGGADLIFPHHECERAQSEAATGEPFVRHWMHQAMVRMDGEKMSKSLGNLVFVSELRKEWDAMAIRLVLVENHYRTGWEWDDTRMPRAAERLERWRAAGAGDGGARRGPGGPRRRPRHARPPSPRSTRRPRPARASARPPPSSAYRSRSDALAARAPGWQTAAMAEATDVTWRRRRAPTTRPTSASSTRTPGRSCRRSSRPCGGSTSRGSSTCPPPVGRSSARTTPR